MTAVTERSIDKGRLNYISSSSLIIRCDYLSYTFSLSYNYLTLWLICSLLIRF